MPRRREHHRVHVLHVERAATPHRRRRGPRRRTGRSSSRRPRPARRRGGRARAVPGAAASAPGMRTTVLARPGADSYTSGSSPQSVSSAGDPLGGGPLAAGSRRRRSWRCRSGSAPSTAPPRRRPGPYARLRTGPRGRLLRAWTRSLSFPGRSLVAEWQSRVSPHPFVRACDAEHRSVRWRVWPRHAGGARSDGEPPARPLGSGPGRGSPYEAELGLQSSARLTKRNSRIRRWTRRRWRIRRPTPIRRPPTAGPTRTPTARASWCRRPC